MPPIPPGNLPGSPVAAKATPSEPVTSTSTAVPLRSDTHDSALSDSESEDGDDSDAPPEAPVRWVHGGAQYLDLLTTPVTSLNNTYVSFSDSENRRLEEAWARLTDEQKEAAKRKSGKSKEEKAKEKEKEKKADDKEAKVEVESVGVTGRGKEQVPASDVLGDHIEYDEPESDEGDEATGDDTPAAQAPETYYPDPEFLEHERHGGSFPFPGNDAPSTPSSSSNHHHVRIASGTRGGHRHRPDGMLRKQSLLDTTPEDDLDIVRGVAVSQDGMFEVSLETMSLSPVFWAHNGPRVPVIRATWFVNSYQTPCEWELADALEKGYQEIKPWLKSYPQELQKAIEQGSDAEEKLKVKLDEKFASFGQSVVYQDAVCGQLVQTGMSSYLNKIFWSSMRSKAGGTMVYRGYDAALKATGGKQAQAQAAAGGSRRSSSTATDHRRSASVSKPMSAGSRLSAEMDRKVKSQDESEAGALATKESTTPAKKREIKDLAVDALEGVRDRAKDLAQDARAQVHLPGSPGHKSRAMREQSVPVTGEEEEDEPCTDLILVIHGIGQQLAAQYEGFNFVYATNMLRQVMKTQGQNKAIASIVRDRRVQVLPIQWRTSLQLEHRDDEEDARHGMNNRFTMADITLTKVPMLRQLTNSVLLDIPMFMSHHRQAMIEAVCSQANRAYRMFCARNPGFDGKGRVHIIAHSLGSALATHILSEQPTHMPPLSQLPRNVRSQTKHQFLFNTSNLFFVGSPLGIFLHLDQAQIMPRRGRERTKNSPPDEALDRAGRFGCMAIDSLYNIVYLSDPVAYTLNATVDCKIAKSRPPMPIASVTAPFYASATDPLKDLGKYFEGMHLPSLPFRKTHAPSADKEKETEKMPAAVKPSLYRLPSGLHMSGPAGEERLQGSIGERRLSALNPHGCLDFSLPGSAIMSEYIDALTSHAAYWSSNEFGAFLLTEIFSTRLDMIRTGMGLQQEGEVEQEGIPL